MWWETHPGASPAGSKTQLSDDWASKNQLPVGDRSPSQQFLWRSLSFLRSGGVAALLVNATALHNSRSTSRHFRSRWLQEAELREVVNFTSSRTLFFDRCHRSFHAARLSTSEGVNVLQARRGCSRTARFDRRDALAATGALAHAQLERRWVNQDALANRDYLWKTYAWGNHHDEALMARLDAEERLKNFLPDDPAPGFGYQRGTARPSERLRSLRSLKRFDYLGTTQLLSSFEDPPTGAKRQPDERLYDGQRIVIASRCQERLWPGGSPRDQTVLLPAHGLLPSLAFRPRLAGERPFSARCCRLSVAIRLFMASGSWGIWHDTLSG